MNVLHFNFGNKVVDGNITSTEGVEWIWTHGDKWNYFETTMDGIQYNVYFADYYQAVEAGATTEQLVQGVYLDKSCRFMQGWQVLRLWRGSHSGRGLGLEQCLLPRVRRSLSGRGLLTAPPRL